MDALILSCGTGGGHDAAAKAMSEAMQRAGHTVTMLNPYTLRSSRLSDQIDHTYISTVQHMPKLFGMVYKIGDAYRKLPFRSPVYYVNHAMNRVLQDYLQKHPVDVILMPHLFPAEILTNMRQHGLMVPKTIFIATDYTCIPFTEETNCDAYVIPAKDLTDDFAGRGIPREKIYPLGIPVSGTFDTDLSVEKAREELGLDPDKKYVLAAGGSMGGGTIGQTIQKLREHFQNRPQVVLVVVCGSNAALYQKLSEHADEGLIVIGRTERMAVYLRACDVFVTKPGGLSSTEAAVSQIPLVHMATIPGCESKNAAYFSGHGMSLAGEWSEELLAAMDELLEQPKDNQPMCRHQREQIDPHAAAQICQLAERLVLENQNENRKEESE